MGIPLHDSGAHHGERRQDEQVATYVAPPLELFSDALLFWGDDKLLVVHKYLQGTGNANSLCNKVLQVVFLLMLLRGRVLATLADLEKRVREGVLLIRSLAPS